MSPPTAVALLLTVYLVFQSHADENYFRFDGQAKPEVETLHYAVSEHADNGTLVGDIMADARLQQLFAPEVVSQLYFRFLSTPPEGAAMSLDRQRGLLRTAGEVDREAVTRCRHLDTCLVDVDVAVGPASHFHIIRVTVEIRDVNDHAPHFPQSTAAVRVRESATAGSSFPLPVAADEDGPQYGVRRYEMTSSTNKLALVVESRDARLVPRLVLLSALDREWETEYQVRLTAYDGGEPSLSAAVDIVVIVLDANDHSPVFDSERYEVELLESVPVGSVIVRVQVTNYDTAVLVKVQVESTLM